MNIESNNTSIKKTGMSVMRQVITREWQITKAYIDDIALHSGLIKLDWNDFKAFAEEHRPVVAVRNEGNASATELIDNAMTEIRNRCSNKLSNIIVSISYKEGEVLMMDEMEGINDCLDMFANENIEIKWGISQNNTLKCRRCVSVFAFE